MFNKEFKKEWIIKKLNENDNGKIIDILYNIARGYFDCKEREMGNER